MRGLPWPGGRDGQQGSATIEAALLLPIVLGAGVAASDLYLVSRARADLERSTATLSTILASQKSLTADGVDQVVSGILGGRSDRYEMFVGKVWRNGKVAWSLPLGNASGLCENPLASSPYQEQLPERDTGDDTNSVAMLVVLSCQEVSALQLNTLTLATPVLKSVATDRLRTAAIELDDTLRNRAGLTEADE